MRLRSTFLLLLQSMNYQVMVSLIRKYPSGAVNQSLERQAQCEAESSDMDHTSPKRDTFSPTKFSFLGHETTKNELMILWTCWAFCFLLSPTLHHWQALDNNAVDFSSLALAMQEVDTLFHWERGLLDEMARVLAGCVFVNCLG